MPEFMDNLEILNQMYYLDFLKIGNLHTETYGFYASYINVSNDTITLYRKEEYNVCNEEILISLIAEFFNVQVAQIKFKDLSFCAVLHLDKLDFTNVVNNIEKNSFKKCYIYKRKIPSFNMVTYLDYIQSPSFSILTTAMFHHETITNHDRLIRSNGWRETIVVLGDL